MKFFGEVFRALALLGLFGAGVLIFGVGGCMLLTNIPSVGLVLGWMWFFVVLAGLVKIIERFSNPFEESRPAKTSSADDQQS